MESSLYNMIASALTHKTNPKIYLQTDIEAIQNYPGNLVRVYDCTQADIIVISSVDEIPQEYSGKILFGTKYSHLKNSRVVGVFFWQKGRPNILFYKNRLDKYSVKLDSSFNKYIEP